MSTLPTSKSLADHLRDWTNTLPWSEAARRYDSQARLALLSYGDEALLPIRIRRSRVAMKYFRLFAGLDWEHFPDRPFQKRWPDALPLACFVAAYLVKLDQHFMSMEDVVCYLVDHPELAWILGFPLGPRPLPWQVVLEVSLPTPRHWSRLLRNLPNEKLQYLLDETVRLIRDELAWRVEDFGQTISLDTKHVIAWVKANNPKAYVEDRFNKTNQPKGDPDCRLGCKRRHNQRTSKEPPATPSTNPLPAKTIQVGEFFWGYASGVVATKVSGWGEFVLAELTQPFDRSDISCFFPLMAATERRLGFRPKYGALDAAFDAFYIYEYFHLAGGFAAVPLVEKGKCKMRVFSEDGLPLCAAGLPMPLKSTYMDRTTNLFEHERGQYVCPLHFPQKTGEQCPIEDPHWPKGGCKTTLATSLGARLRYQIDRKSEAYKQIYRQRTATERINSQAVEIGIERPHIRNGSAIANHNTLIYILLNLRALQRIRQRLATNVSTPAA